VSDKIIIEGAPPFDGEYDFDLDIQPLTAAEWHWIKKIAEYLPMTVEQGWEGRDPMLFVAFAVVALHRAGVITQQQAFQTGKQLADMPVGCITYQGEVEEEDPPAESQKPDDEPENASSSSDASGDASTTSSGTSENDPSPTGEPNSSRSDPAILPI
jgi:hypothetical protein